MRGAARAPLLGGLALIKNAGVWAGVCLLAYSGVLFQQSLTLNYSNPMGPGPGFLPLWLSGILFVVSLCYIWDSAKSAAQDESVKLADLWPPAHARADIFLMLGGLCIFALVVETVGFVVAATQLIFLMTMRKFKWYFALASSVLVAVLLLVAFQTLLGVSLPVNDFGW
ncbi:tripartite tricarboxylate transporter TctB family protein [Propionivibrio soli]|uniref:tripartite tricarboxylate transporter TctB family protein n=1 Tax=Propionivibrio soli TaxID=2976531 RepID=UPI0021E85A92|nr:tripartite tricarboxylate transporter TctB family protein [Propionivibrio soli]